MREVKKNAETNVATEKAPPQTKARLSKTNEDQGRAQSHKITTAEGAPQAVGVGSLRTWPMAIRPWVRDVMRKKYRLRANTDFQRIRRAGTTWVHPLLILSALPNRLEHSRFGFVVGRRIGKAVQRNKIKRRMRESVRARIQEGEIVQSWDVVFIARRPIQKASFQQVDQAIGLLLRRANLVSEAS